MMEESLTLLKELVDKEQIRDLVHRYCWAVDKGTLPDVMALFHDSSTLILAPGKRYEGKAEVERWYDAYMANRM